jgi:hypothetical protein
VDKLGQALDKVSYEWLAEESPELVEAIEEEVARGITPAQIKWFVLRHTQRPALASRCEQAARYLARWTMTDNTMGAIWTSQSWQAASRANDDAEAG